MTLRYTFLILIKVATASFALFAQDSNSLVKNLAYIKLKPENTCLEFCRTTMQDIDRVLASSNLFKRTIEQDEWYSAPDPLTNINNIRDIKFLFKGSITQKENAVIVTLKIGKADPNSSTLITDEVQLPMHTFTFRRGLTLTADKNLFLTHVKADLRMYQSSGRPREHIKIGEITMERDDWKNKSEYKEVLKVMITDVQTKLNEDFIDRVCFTQMCNENEGKIRWEKFNALPPKVVKASFKRKNGSLSSRVVIPFDYPDGDKFLDSLRNSLSIFKR